MKLKPALVAVMLGGCALALVAQAAPPEGKGQGNAAAHAGKGGNGNSKGAASGHGNPGKGNPGKNSQAVQGSQAKRSHDAAHYDDRGRYSGYFDSNRDSRGHVRDDDVSVMIYAGITAALAREYAVDYGLGGYASLPPGIRKNLARGKPLPPGIAKKRVPDSLLGRLPRHSGYEWRMAGSDLVLVSVATAVVADILYDVFD